MAKLVSHAMDLLESHDMQTFVDTFHEYIEYQQHLKWFIFIEIKTRNK
jgi:hypothetical protein